MPAKSRRPAGWGGKQRGQWLHLVEETQGIQVERNAERAVEVASFHQNDMRGVVLLSPSRERRAAVLAGATAGGMLLLAMALGILLLSLCHVVVHAGLFFTAWMAMAGAAAFLAARQALRRARRYVVGASLDADAFGPLEVDLVRRAPSGYQLRLLPGMNGQIDNGRMPLPVESLVAKGPVALALPEQGRVRVGMGPASWVIRLITCVPGKAELSFWQGLTVLTALLRKSLPVVALGLPLAVLVTVLGSAPAVRALTERDLAPALAARATPWEIEQSIRVQAQRQATSLHACFDPMPLQCQRPGYVGVGLSLSKQGDVLSHWVSRSSYGPDCPVTECMAEHAAQWFFEPVPEAMRLILPIQVKRTNKPLQPSSVTISAGM